MKKSLGAKVYSMLLILVIAFIGYNLIANLGLKESQNSISNLSNVYLKMQGDNEVVSKYVAEIRLYSNLINLYPNKIMNIHPSLIPSFCGMGYYGIHVHEKALARGVKVSGATVHFVSEVVDGGPIILQKAVDIAEYIRPLFDTSTKVIYFAEHTSSVKRLRESGLNVEVFKEIEGDLK